VPSQDSFGVGVDDEAGLLCRIEEDAVSRFRPNAINREKKLPEGSGFKLEQFLNITLKPIGGQIKK